MIAQSHHDECQRMLVTLDATPSAIAFHYVRAVLDEEDGNICAAARRMGMHRRTLQRMLKTSRPKAKVAA